MQSMHDGSWLSGVKKWVLADTGLPDHLSNPPRLTPVRQRVFGVERVNVVLLTVPVLQDTFEGSSCMVVTYTLCFKRGD